MSHLLHADLLAAFGARQVVVVVGSGVSIGATGNHPCSSWPGLLSDGVERCLALGLLRREDAASLHANVGSSDPDVFLLTAGLVEQKLREHPGKYTRWLHDALGTLKAERTGVLAALGALGVPLATTNYDNLLEDVTGLPAITWREPDRVERWLRGDERSIFHFHGHWQRPDSIVLGPLSYERVTNDEHVQAVLRAVWLTKTPVFVGCGGGLADPNFSRLLGWASRAQAGSGYRRFVLTTEQECAAVKHPDPGLHAVAYGATHAELAPFLDALCPPRHALGPSLSPGGAELATAPESGPWLPAAWNVTEPRCSNFVGRVKLLERLHQELGSSRSDAVQVIRGLGGVGKTALALEYAYRYAKEYLGVWWLRAADPVTLVADYAALAPWLGLDRSERDDETIHAVRLALSQRARLLLVFDDAKASATLAPFLPQGGRSHVIVTTRGQWQGAREQELEPLDMSDAVSYLLRVTGQNAAAAARAIAAQLGGLPLALEQAAAYVRECSEDLSVYQLRLGARGLVCLAGIESTWSLSLAAVREQRGAVELLNLCAFLAPEAVDLLDLREASRALRLRSAEALPEPLGSVLEDELALNQAKKVLIGYSLASASLATTQGKQLRFHCVLQAVTRQRLAPAEGRLWLGAALRAVNAVLPEELGNVRGWPICDRLLAHARTIVRRAGELYGASWGEMPESDSMALMRLLNQAGLYLRLRGSYSEAELLYRLALQVGEVALGADPALTECATNLALLLCARVDAPEGVDKLELCESRLKEARKLVRHALRVDVARARSDRTHVPAIARDLNSLGMIARAAGRYPDALKWHKRALAIDLRAFGDNHPIVARDLNNLGLVYRLLDRYAEAFEHHERSLQIMGQDGEHGPGFAIGLRNFASLLVDMGRPAEAVAYYEQAHGLMSEQLGHSHPDALKCLGLLVAARDTEAPRGPLPRAASLAPPEVERPEVLQAVNGVSPSAFSRPRHPFWPGTAGRS